MALDKPIVFIVIFFYVAIPFFALYGIYKLIRFVNRVNRFIDEQEREARKEKEELLL